MYASISESKMEARVQGIEDTVQALANKMDVFAGQITQMLGTVQANDAAMKQEIKDQFETLEKGYTQAIADLGATVSNIQGVMTARSNEITNLGKAIATANQEHMTLNDEHMKLRDERTIPMEAAVVKIQSEATQFHTGLAAANNTLENDMKALKMMVETSNSWEDQEHKVPEAGMTIGRQSP